MPDKHDVYLKVLMLPVSFGKTLSFKKNNERQPGDSWLSTRTGFQGSSPDRSKRKYGSRRYSSFLAPSEITTS